MKYSLLSSALFCVSLILSPPLSSQELYFPVSPAPQIDGIMQPGEWDDAYSFQIFSTGNDTDVNVYTLASSTSLFFAFENDLSTGPNFIELFIDLNQDRGSVWANDDWWFHVSATDCEWQGQVLVYDSCEAVRPTWTAHPNWPMAGLGPDTIEIEIPFTLLGLDTLPKDSIGIGMALSNAFNRYDYWPDGGNLNYPSTWGYGIFGAEPNSLREMDNTKKLRLYPNPTSSVLNIDMTEEFQSIRIINISGSVVSVYFSGQAIDVSHLESGIYFVHLKTKDDGILVGRFSKL